jgi:Cd2+/Zn2+-exporting ATPase
MDDDPLKVAKAVRISKKVMNIVRQNIVFALSVKGVCLILGALGVAGMPLAVFADVGVMVLAVLNALRAMKVKNI